MAGRSEYRVVVIGGFGVDGQHASSGDRSGGIGLVIKQFLECYKLISEFIDLFSCLFLNQGLLNAFARVGADDQIR